jgi:ABC-2 type transport system permease protein
MTAALRYEWVRLTTVRSTYHLSVLALVGTVLVAWGMANNLHGDQQQYAQALTAGAQLPPLLLGLIGVFAFGHEYRFGMIRPTLTALPRRSQVAAAKVLLVLAWALVVSLLCLVLAYATANLVAADTSGLSVGAGPTERMLLGTVLWTLLWAVVGLAYGGLFRNVPASVSLLIIVPLLVENVLHGLLQIHALRSIHWLGNYLPFSAGQQLFTWPNGGNGAFTSTLSPFAGGLTLAVFAGGLLALSWALFERRDA